MGAGHDMRTHLCTATVQLSPPSLTATIHIQQHFLPLKVDRQKSEVKGWRSEVEQEKTTHSIGKPASDHEKRLQLNGYGNKWVLDTWIVWGMSTGIDREDVYEEWENEEEDVQHATTGWEPLGADP